MFASGRLALPDLPGKTRFGPNGPKHFYPQSGADLMVRYRIATCCREMFSAGAEVAQAEDGDERGPAPRRAQQNEAPARPPWSIRRSERGAGWWSRAESNRRPLECHS